MNESNTNWLDFDASGIVPGAIIERKIFKEFQFKGSDLSDVTFHKCSFIDCAFSGEVLARANFHGSTFSNCSIRDIEIIDCDFSDALILDSDFDVAQFVSCNFQNASFTNTDLDEVTFSKSEMTGSSISMSNLRQVDFTASDFSQLTQSHFDECIFGQLSGGKIYIDKCWFNNCEFLVSNFESAYISQSTLIDVQLNNAKLEDAQIVRCVLSNISLTGSYGPRSVWTANRISNSQFEDFDLCDSTWVQNALVDVDLTGAKLENTDIRLNQVTSQIVEHNVEFRNNIDSATETRMTFDVEELITILREFGIETEFAEVDDSDEDQIPALDCELGDIGFTCLMFPAPNHFSSLVIGGNRTVESEPMKFANDFNRGHQNTVVQARVYPDGAFQRDETGEYLVSMRKWLDISGGVTLSHVEYFVATFIEDLFDFHEIEFQNDEVEPGQNELSDEVQEMDVASQIAWVLEDQISRSARELAERLMVDKHTINQTLYKNRDLFIREGGQPPRWIANRRD